MPERVETVSNTWAFFRTLGIQPLLGRDFRADEDRLGAARVVIISFGLWQLRFGAAPDILQRTLRLDDESYQIIGVMPRGFSFRRDIQIWVPLQQVFPVEEAANRPPV